MLVSLRFLELRIRRLACLDNGKPPRLGAARRVHSSLGWDVGDVLDPVVTAKIDCRTATCQLIRPSCLWFCHRTIDQPDIRCAAGTRPAKVFLSNEPVDGYCCPASQHLRRRLCGLGGKAGYRRRGLVDQIRDEGLSLHGNFGLRRSACVRKMVPMVPWLGPANRIAKLSGFQNAPI